MKKYMEKLKNIPFIRFFTIVEITLLFVSLILFLVNRSYLSYPDEFVNILGGKAILHGELPYKDFFDHHLPFAWYLSAFLLAFSFGSFVLFRFYYALFTFSCLFALACWLKKNYRDMFPYYLAFILLYPLMGIYYWFHLFVADSLAILFLSMTFWILFSQTVHNRIHKQSIYWASFLTFCLIFSALTYVYLAVGLYVWQAYLLLRNKKDILKLVGIAVLPYFIYFVYLLITGSLKDFYISNFVYNTQLYIDIPNYTRGPHFNPIKFCMTLISNFYGNYIPLLSKIKYFDLYLPVSVLAGLGSLALFILLLTRNIPVALFFFLILSFSAPRSNIQSANEGDYQGSLFLMLGMISSFFVLYVFEKTQFKEVWAEDVKRITQFIMRIFFLFSFIFLSVNAYNKYFMRYTQKMPSINNVSYSAAFIDQIVDPGHYYWIGPYEPQEEFFVKNAKLPGKYISLLPQFKENDYFKSAFLQQFDTHRPEIIIYRQDASIFGTPALQFGDFFLDWMKGKYTRMEYIKGVKVIGSPSSFNLSGDLYLEDSRRTELLQRLRSNHYIE